MYLDTDQDRLLVSDKEDVEPTEEACKLFCIDVMGLDAERHGWDKLNVGLEPDMTWKQALHKMMVFVAPEDRAEEEEADWKEEEVGEEEVVKEEVGEEEEVKEEVGEEEVKEEERPVEEVVGQAMESEAEQQVA